MAASTEIDPFQIPLSGVAAQILVAKYDRTAGTGDEYSLLPNVFCNRILRKEGATPSTAQFSYLLDNSDPASPFPVYIEDVWPLGSSGPFVVGLGDEIVVFAVDDNGEASILFDGFADAPQVDLNSKGQQITFAASGVEIRCWDRPIPGAVYRDATDPEAGAAVKTELRARFNPDGKPNATPLGFDVAQGTSQAYPVFLDHRLNRTPDRRRAWTLGMFTRYIFATRDTSPGGDVDYVDDPGSNFTDADLQAVEPAGGPNGVIDLTDPTSYQTSDVVLDDVVASERAWPELLEATLDRHGFGFRFVLGQTDRSAPSLPLPKTSVEIFRKDGLFEPEPKSLRLQAGGLLDPAKTNVASITMMRDAKNVANSFELVSRPTRYEVGIILAPGFTPAAADAAGASSVAQFLLPAIVNASAEVRAKYRRFVADEAGDGHYDFATSAWTTSKPIDLKPVFGPYNAGDPPTFVRRRRPGEDSLFSSNGDLKPFRAELAVSTDYSGPSPAVWDGAAGTWQSMGHNGWKMLDDRLGIEISVENPNGVKMPDVPPSGTQVIPGGVLRVVESMAAPSASHPKFFFKLTCVIEGDFGFKAEAPRRTAASPVPFTVRRRIDARDVYAEEDVHKSSFHNSTGATYLPRNDALKADAQAQALRAKNEFPAVLATAAIPSVTLAYSIGDRVSKIAGREIDLRTNAGAAARESPRYPVVVGLTYDFTGNRQSTVLELSARLA